MSRYPVRAGTRRLATGWVAALSVLLLIPSTGAPAPVDIVGRHGIRPIDPPTPGTDFTLPAAGGGSASLSDFHGSWMVLTFFATWCPACRSQMPSLEQVSQRLSNDGLVVLGVSVDEQEDPLRPYVGELGLTFPVLWDARGEVAATYRATSVPTSYLVDPTGRLVGVSRGARDWTELVPMLDELLAEVPPDSDPTRAYVAAGSGPLELPSNVEPPTADVSLLTESPVAGTPFSMEVRLNWAGSFEEYLPQPPRVHLPEGVERRQVTASTSSRDGRHVVTYRLELQADEPGSYALDPVELRYVTRTEAQPLTSRLLGPTVEVRQRNVLGMAPLYLALSALGLLLAGGLGYVLVRKLGAGRPRAADLGEDRHRGLRERFDEAKARRMRGDPAGCVLLLAEIDQELGDSGDEPLVANVEEMVERARYGGEAPPPEELDRIQRRVERRLDALRPDPDQKQREAIRLAESARQPAEPDAESEREK